MFLTRLRQCPRSFHGLRPRLPVEVKGEPVRSLAVTAVVKEEIPLGLPEAVDWGAVVAEVQKFLGRDDAA